MSRKIAFHFDDWNYDAYSGRRIDLDTWRYTFKAYGIDQFVIIDQTKLGLDLPIQALNNNFTWKLYKSLKEFEEDTKNEDKIYLETSWVFPDSIVPSIMDKDYVHPENTWYVLGPTEGHKLTEDKKWLSIPQIGKGALHASHIIQVLAWDIYTKDN